MIDHNRNTQPISKPEPYTFSIAGMDCPSCAAKIEKAIAALHGVKSASVDLLKSRLVVQFNYLKDIDAVQQKVRSLGYSISVSPDTPQPKTNRKHLILTITCGLFTAAGIIHNQIHSADALTIPLYLIAILSGGYYIAKKGLAALWNLSLDMNSLMTIAVIGAAIIGEWDEAAVVIFLFSVAHLLEGYSLDRARNSIRKLMDLSPKQTLVQRNGGEFLIPVENVEIGDVVIIKPGSNVSVDGIVIAGASSINQAAITGESMPVQKAKGDDVFAGTLNQQGTLEVKATRLYADTELARTIHLVEEAQAQRAPSQNFIDRFASIYTPAVVGLALLIAVIPPVLLSASFAVWFYRALVILVIACPCALVISTPVTIISALATAARAGVLIKGGIYLEQAGKLKCMALDKTGTLTSGQPKVIDVIPVNNTDRKELIALAGSLESRSEHPLASAIVQFASQEAVERIHVTNFQSIPGSGVKGTINGTEYFLGSHAMFEKMGSCNPAAHQTLTDIENANQTAILLGKKNHLMGIFAIADQIRPSAQQVIDALKRNGIAHTVMLTGDNRRTAHAIGENLNIDEIRAELLPQDKVIVVKQLRSKYHSVAMVGDGVNDAPALAAATMGIAMGTAGTDAALETADIALMADDLTRLPFLMKLSRKTLRIIKQNIALAIAIKAVFLALAIPGYATLWMAVFADMGASLIVIFNGLRTLRT
jgi:Cd2+/Zn2+-exporting ATPase